MNSTDLMTIALVCFSSALLLPNAVSASDKIDLSGLPEVANNTISARGSGSAFIFNAGTVEKKAYVRLGTDPVKGVPLNLDIEIGVPYSEKVKKAVMADFNGLFNDTTVTANASYNWLLDAGITPDFKVGMETLCKKYLGPEWELGGCDVNHLTAEAYKNTHGGVTVTETELKAWHDGFRKEHEKLIRSTPTKALISGLKSTLGWKELSYQNESVAAISSTETSWNVTAYGNYLFNVNERYWVVGGGANIEESYNVGESGKLEKQTRKVLFAQVNWTDPDVSILWFGLGIAPKVSFDLEKDSVGLELPIYLVRNDKGDLSGGVSFGWQSETDEMTASVFMGKSFNWF